MGLRRYGEPRELFLCFFLLSNSISPVPPDDLSSGTDENRR
jgi:hypothetical protein